MIDIKIDRGNDREIHEERKVGQISIYRQTGRQIICKLKDREQVKIRDTNYRYCNKLQEDVLIQCAKER